ncbi:hypothetical protein [Nocardiopsis ansamitocini]|uniref:Uncharacterized protein n=1 Tax=Nocardiopsis ansamitocini TaxID=1670832 RepID=A0A9W6P5V0_9ACTN|nr:hypothetical protein [Nocardiopsis ansamitocini]GLU47619.1 hypothetical protein Nans01_19700 [Nocardiopsis ansamitocini]
MTEKFEGAQKKTAPEADAAPAARDTSLPDVPRPVAADAASSTDAATAAEAIARPRAFDSVGATTGAPLEAVDPTARLGRPGAPVLAGAAIAGLILVAAPFAVSAGTQDVSLETVPLSAGSLADGADGSAVTQAGLDAGSGDRRQAASGDDAGSGGGGGVNDAPEDTSAGYVPEAKKEESGGSGPLGASPSPGEDGGESGGGGAGAPSEEGTRGGSVASSGGERETGGGADEKAPEASMKGEDAPGIIDSLPGVGGSQAPSGDAAPPAEKGAKAAAAPAEDEEAAEPEGRMNAFSAAVPSEEPSGEPSPEGDAEPSPEASPDEADGEAADASASPEPSDAPSPSPSASPSESGPAYSEVAGPGCAEDGPTSYGRTGMWEEGEGFASWATRDANTDAEGCYGTYDAIPVSGDPERGDGQFAHWTFTPGTAGASCELLVYVPDDESPLWVGEAEAKYQIFPGDRPEGDSVGIFGIGQSEVRGGWVKVVGLVSPAESFTVQLTNIGENTLADQEGRSSHVAAGAIRATCD